jgi:hypothetical protein
MGRFLDLLPLRGSLSSSCCPGSIYVRQFPACFFLGVIRPKSSSTDLLLMKKAGSVALSDVAAKTTHLEIACTRCERRGRYQLARLVTQLGPDFPMTSLGAELAPCPNRNITASGKRCDVYFPGLAAIMNKQ